MLRNFEQIILQFKVKVVEINTPVSYTHLLRRLLDKTDIISYQKVIPGMNDIFIKLVKGEMVKDVYKRQALYHYYQEDIPEITTNNIPHE